MHSYDLGGGTLAYSAAEIGWKLRDMRIPRHRSRSGQEVVLDRGTSQSVHKLARFYDLPCAQPADVDCPDCKQEKPILSK